MVPSPKAAKSAARAPVVHGMHILSEREVRGLHNGPELERLDWLCKVCTSCRDMMCRSCTTARIQAECGLVRVMLMSGRMKTKRTKVHHGARNRAQPASCTARRLQEALELDPQNGPGVEQMGNYVVTYGTGQGDFVYLSRDVERWLGRFRPVAVEDREDSSDEPYTAFCRACSPVTSRGIAFRVARELGRRVRADGSGRCVLTGAEWTNAREGR